ncbi:hypothetical protein HY496_00385 [Candidatus Woesearchaeota archaeon]|nr:hypothetical protein [Candidatus Woesearchaeota archaeon]
MSTHKKRRLRTRSARSRKAPAQWHATPLKGSFMAASILGILITLYLVYPANPSYGVAFLVVFGAMFVASLVSMTKAPVVD